MKDDNKFTDVTLAWEDGQLYQAHKVISAGCNPQTNTPTLMFELKGSSSDDKKSLKIKHGLVRLVEYIAPFKAALNPKAFYQAWDNTNVDRCEVRTNLHC